jgi:hypothetical protein
MTKHEIQTLLVFSARYSHTRQTGAAYQVVNAIKNNWDSIDDRTRLQLICESQNEATCNYEDWNQLLELDKG